MSKYNIVNIRKNSIDEKNSIKNSVGYKKSAHYQIQRAVQLTSTEPFK